MAPLVKLGNHYKKVSEFQKRIPNIPRILELDHLTITGDVNLGKNVTLRGTVIIVASNNDTIDIPPGSVLENVRILFFSRSSLTRQVVVTGSLRILEH
jgi:UTP--glucose-1-phosphate uridylyltransferase